MPEWPDSRSLICEAGLFAVSSLPPPLWWEGLPGKRFRGERLGEALSSLIPELLLKNRFTSISSPLTFPNLIFLISKKEREIPTPWAVRRK